MIPELGNLALILALTLNLILGIVPLIRTLFLQRQYSLTTLLMDPPALQYPFQLARSLAIGQSLFLFFSFFTLTEAFVVNDFSVAYVANNSHSQLPLIYRLTAVWGAHEGSMLLWAVILSLWILCVALWNKNLPKLISVRVLSVLGLVASGFLIFILATSSPFLRLFKHIPKEGLDLNPLLQDPGLILHPPMLYMGYVGFSVAFAFAVTALINGRLDSRWAQWARPWTLVAWCFLSFGIVLGSWWSYRELGWGGWWAWDPVENASFLPWLVGTALIHCLTVTEKRGIFKGWTAILAISAFSLSLLGTFLVRSGILTSVHAFVLDPRRGAYMLVYLALVVGAALTLYLLRAHRLQSKNTANYLSKECFLLFNNVILYTMMLSILIGTLYPLLLNFLQGEQISVGAPYFNLIFTPLTGILLIAMGLGPLCYWQRSPRQILIKSILLNLLSLVLLAAILMGLFIWKMHYLVLFKILFIAWMVNGTGIAICQPRFPINLQHFISKQKSFVAHLGLGVSLLGIVLSNAFSIESQVALSVHDRFNLGNHRFIFNGIDHINGPNYTAERAELSLETREGKSLEQLYPEKRRYNASQTVMTEAAIHVNPFYDVYATLGQPLADGSWTFRFYYKPFIRFIWFGGLLMIFGGLLALIGRRSCNKV